jgi:hypothetical protein
MEESAPQMDYLWQLFRKAWSQTWDAVFNSPFITVLLAILVFAISTFIHWQRKGFSDVKDVLVIGLEGAIATGIVFVIVFAFHFLFLTPKRVNESLIAQIHPGLVEEPRIRIDVADTDARKELAKTKTKLDQAYKTIDALSPLKQPIASVRITVTASIPSDKSGASEYVGQGAIVWLSKGDTALLSANAGDHSSDGKGNISFVAECSPDNSYMGKPIGRLTDAEYIQVAFAQEYMPINSIVTGGKVTFVVNNQVTLNFSVPRQTLAVERELGRMATLMFVRDLKDGLAPLLKAETVDQKSP